MNVLMVCSEFAPLAKTGGLADAVTGLANALAALGHDVRVLLPRYAHLAAVGSPFQPLGGDRRYRFLRVPPTGPASTAPTVYLLELDELTGDEIYLGDDRDAGRFMRLAAAALELGPALDWRPDILHCHDWHAALTPVLQRAAGEAAGGRTLLTLHNVGYQGVFADSVLDDYGPPALRAALASDALADGNVNFLRAGLHAADVVTTVSPTYAAEIRTPAFGMGLDDVLRTRGDSLVGILNGVDYGVWDPAHDPFIDVHYDATDLAPKQRQKAALASGLGLGGEARAPLIGIVSRLVAQKGIDLVTAILPTLLAETRAGIAVLGSGDPGLAADLTRLAQQHPQRVSFTNGYDEALAHRIFAGCDLTLVPSRYEPCGLTQLYALRYGTIPVVRSTGGLADTIRHYDPASGTGNGSVFRDADPQGLLWGIRTALAWYDDPAAWSRLLANAMAADFSWQHQAPQYESLYRRLL
jgi:starch synthase